MHRSKKEANEERKPYENGSSFLHLDQLGINLKQLYDSHYQHLVILRQQLMKLRDPPHPFYIHKPLGKE